jgi:hypothetical protein
MGDSGQRRPEDAPLNPALKSTTDRIYDTTHSSPAPVDTTSAKENEGEGWPIIWLVVTVVCIVLALYFLL